MIGDRSSSYDFDPTKLCITVTGLGITGAEVEILLREDYGIEVELSDLYNVLCLITPGDTEELVDRLVTALAKIAAVCFQSGRSARWSCGCPRCPRWPCRRGRLFTWTGNGASLCQ